MTENNVDSGGDAPIYIPPLAGLRTGPLWGAVVRSFGALAQPWTVVLILVLLVNDHVLRWRWPSWVTGKLGDIAWLGFAPLVVAALLASAAYGLARVFRRGAIVPIASAAPAHVRCGAIVPIASAAPAHVRCGAIVPIASAAPAHVRCGAIVPIASAAPAPCARDRVIWLAIALVGGVFAVVKSSPQAATSFREGFRAVFGWTPLLVSDPLDLLTLPALAVAWLLWRLGSRPRLGSRRRLASPVPAHAISRRSLGVLCLATLATIANSGPPDSGLNCLALRDGQVLVGARSTYAYTPTYASADGGLTWTPVSDEVLIEAAFDTANRTRCEERGTSWVLETSRSSFRFTQGVGIDRSADGGRTWTPSLTLTGNEARWAYYRATRYSMEGGSGPYDAVIDPATGNVVVAMGHEGVLVLSSADGTSSGAEDGSGDPWLWIAAGDYRFEPITRPAQVFTLLQKEIGLALAAAFMTVAFCAWWPVKWPWRVVSVLVGLAIVVLLLAVRPATVSGYAGMALALVAIGVPVVSLVPAVVALVRLVGSGKRTLALGLGSGLLTGTACLVPFVLWAAGVIAHYGVAAGIAAVAVSITWLACAARSPRPHSAVPPQGEPPSG